MIMPLKLIKHILLLLLVLALSQTAYNAKATALTLPVGNTLAK